MDNLIDLITPESFWEWFQWGVTFFFLFILTRSLFLVGACYRSARHELGELGETYDDIIAKCHGHLASSKEELKAQRRIAYDDNKALLTRLEGIGRRVKLHDICRKRRENLRRDVEQARTRTESMPIVGILGTIFGLVIASIGQDSIQAMTSGIWIALTSSLFALSFTLIAKSTWEAAVVSQIENLEDRENVVYEYVSLMDVASSDEPHEYVADGPREEQAEETS